MKSKYLLTAFAIIFVLHGSTAQQISTTQTPSQESFQAGITTGSTPQTLTPYQESFEVGLSQRSTSSIETPTQTTFTGRDSQPSQIASLTQAITKDVTIGLAAKNFLFNKSTITVPAGANVTIDFDNMDPGVEHNFSVNGTAGANEQIFVGDEITGPGKIVYNFEAPVKAGTYFFKCDDHPKQMKGDFIVQ